MSAKERQKMYKETKFSISRMLEKGQSIDKKLITNQLILIKRDAASDDEIIRKAALSMLEFLLNTNYQYIQREIVKELNDYTENKAIQSLFMKLMRKQMIDNILECQNFINFVSSWQNQNITTFIIILEEVCMNNLPRDKCKYLFLKEVIPAMMSMQTEDDVRNILIDIAFVLSTIIPISDLTPEELKIFLEEVNSKYISTISQLREKDYSNWHNLWIFLVRFSDKKIHNSMDLTNRLLRVVEFAFRNSSVQQRLKGYDCWKELIDNASLDINHISSPKQIKLLITPLRAKFSKQEVVICKRFDVFVYLLEKLQKRAVLCLREFLEFCFGPLGDNKDESKTSQVKSVPEIWPKTTKVLMEIIGHSHGKNVDCLPTEDIIKLEKPIINHHNLPIFFQSIINSVSECCILLKDLDMDSKKMQVIKCMWISVFSLIVPPSEMREKYFPLLGDILENYIKKSSENPYFEDLLGLIFIVLISYDKDSNYHIHECIHSVLEQLITIVMKIENIPSTICDHFKQIISHSFSQVMLRENKLKMMNMIINCFKSVKPKIECAPNISKIWLCVVSELISDLTKDKIEEFDQTSDFLLWPAYNLHCLDEKVRKQIVINWMKLYKKLSSNAEEKKQVIMGHLETIFKNNPLLASNVVSLLNVMSQFETKFAKDFVIKLMNVSSSILLLPILKIEDVQKITALVMQYFEATLDCFKSEEDNDDVIKEICTSIKHILCIHEGFKLLESLANFINNCPKDMRIKLSKYLEVTLLDLYNKESDTKSHNAKELSKVLGLLSEKDAQDVKKTFVIPSGRSARIASLVKNSPKTPLQNQKAIQSPSVLKLFGKDPETMSPVRVRGSQLNNSTPTRTKSIARSARMKTNNTPSINEENSSEFVKIDTEIKFQPNKLNEHQKEVMRKRREDIPALYQDLSQSLSQDIFSSKTNSKEAVDELEVKETIDKSQKVIVEMIDQDMFASKVTDQQDCEPIETDMDQNKQSNIVIQNEISKAVENPNSEVDLFSEDINNLPSENIKSSDIISASEDNLKINKRIDTETAALKNGSESQPPHSEGDLFSQEQEQKAEKTESKHSADDVKDDKSGIPRQQVEETPSKGKKKKKIEAELERLKMDIVGADKFFETSRRTRLKKKPKNIDGTVKDVTKSRRKSASPDKTELTTDKNRRKTIGVVHNTENATESEKTDHELAKTSKQILSSDSPTKSNENKTPASKRKSVKANLVEKTDDKPNTVDKDTPVSKRKAIKSHVTGDEDVDRVPKSNQQIPIEPGTKPVNGKSKKVDSDTRVEVAHLPDPETNEQKTPRGRRKSIQLDAVKHSKTDKSGSNKKSKNANGENKEMLNSISLEEREKNLSVEKIEQTEDIEENATEMEQRTPNKIHQSRGEKRKHSTDDDDIIESSQESFAEVTPLLNSSKKRQIISGLVTNSVSDELTLVQQKTVTAADFISDVKVTEANHIELVEETELLQTDEDQGKLEESEKSNVAERTLETQATMQEVMEHTEKNLEEIDMVKMSEDETHVAVEQPEVGINRICDENSELKESHDVQLEISKEVNTTQDTTLTQDSTHDSSQTHNSTQDSIPTEDVPIKVATQDTQTQPTFTQETPTQQDPSPTNEDNVPPTLYFDLPKKPNLTESEQMMCRMDTMSICGVKTNTLGENEDAGHQSMEEIELVAKTTKEDGGMDNMYVEDILATPSTNSAPSSSSSPTSPDRTTGSLPSSPITIDTPTRTTKLLDDTMDISPIPSNSSSPIKANISADVPLNFQEEQDEMEMLKKCCEAGAWREDTDEKNGDSTSSDDSDDLQNGLPISSEKDHYSDIGSMPEDETSEQHEDILLQNEDILKSSKDPSTIQERTSKLLNMVNINSPMSHNIFIKRRVAGTTSSPSTRRIRKLMSSFCPKQTINVAEEINEDDILTFSREVPSPLAVPKSSILKRKFCDTSDPDGVSPCPKRKRVNFSDPCLTSKKLFIKDDFHPSLEAKRLFDPLIEPKSEDNLKDIFDFPEDSGSSNQLSETENIETEPSLDILNPMILRKDRPIYPKLVDCKDDVLVILKRVTSPMFINTLTNKLKSKHIKTIGDLAQQSEAEINRFPFKVPVVANVFKALDNYYKKKVNVNGEAEVSQKVDGNKEDRNKAIAHGSNIVVPKIDVASELKTLMQTAVKENYPMEDLARIVINSLDKRKVISLVKNHESSVSIIDFLEENDYNLILKYISKNKTIYEILSQLREHCYKDQAEEFSNSIKNYTRCLVSSQNSWDVQDMIQEAVKKNISSKEEIIKHCFLPLISSPSDISCYLNSISMVDFGNIVINRLEKESLGELLARIKEAHPQTFLQSVCENGLSSPEEITNSFRNVVEACSGDVQTRIMKDMFKFISKKLDISTLVDLHVEFLKTIPSILASRDE